MKNSMNYYPVKFSIKIYFINCCILSNPLDRNKNLAIDLLAHSIVKTQYVGQCVMVQKLNVQFMKIIIPAKNITYLTELKVFVSDNSRNPFFQNMLIGQYKFCFKVK